MKKAILLIAFLITANVFAQAKVINLKKTTIFVKTLDEVPFEELLKTTDQEVKYLRKKVKKNISLYSRVTKFVFQGNSILDVGVVGSKSIYAKNNGFKKKIIPAGRYYKRTYKKSSEKYVAFDHMTSFFQKKKLVDGQYSFVIYNRKGGFSFYGKVE